MSGLSAPPPRSSALLSLFAFDVRMLRLSTPFASDTPMSRSFAPSPFGCLLISGLSAYPPRSSIFLPPPTSNMHIPGSSAPSTSDMLVSGFSTPPSTSSHLSVPRSSASSPSGCLSMPGLSLPELSPLFPIWLSP